MSWLGKSGLIQFSTTEHLPRPFLGQRYVDGNNSSPDPLERVRLVNITSHEQARDTGVGRMSVSGLPESHWETSYAHIVMERHQALISSPVFRGMRRSWLRMFSRRTPFASVD